MILFLPRKMGFVFMCVYVVYYYLLTYSMVQSPS